MDFLKALIGLGVISAIAVGLTEINWENGRRTLQQAIEEGKICTAAQQSSCRIGDYMIQRKSLAEIVEDRNLDDYVPSSACEHGMWSNAVLNEKLVTFCKLQKHPMQFSEADKLRELRN